MRRIESSKVVAIDGKAAAASTKKLTFKYDFKIEIVFISIT
jgi:hypothetical protein